MTSKPRISELHAGLTEIRRDLHAHPEIGFEEHCTSDIVAANRLAGARLDFDSGWSG